MVVELLLLTSSLTKESLTEKQNDRKRRGNISQLISSFTLAPNWKETKGMLIQFTAIFVVVKLLKDGFKISKKNKRISFCALN